MVDSFIFHIDWIIVSVVIGLLVALIGAFLYPHATTIKLPAMPPRRFPPPWSVEEQKACFVVPTTTDRSSRTRLRLLRGRARPAIDGKACGVYLVVLGLSIICFMKSIAASGVG